MKCRLKSFIHCLKEGKSPIHIFICQHCFLSFSDPEFDKLQEEFDQMIERQPITVRENDFEYQVKTIISSAKHPLHHFHFSSTVWYYLNVYLLHIHIKNSVYIPKHEKIFHQFIEHLLGRHCWMFL